MNACRSACALVAAVSAIIVTSCARAPAATDPATGFVEVLGSQDGYVFIFNPLNCSLRKADVEAINMIASRSRLRGHLLVAGLGSVDSVSAAQAVSDLALTIPTSLLVNSPVHESPFLAELGWPTVVAIRHGRVVASISGANANRIASWVRWMEGEPLTANASASVK